MKDFLSTLMALLAKLLPVKVKPAGKIEQLPPAPARDVVYLRAPRVPTLPPPLPRPEIPPPADKK